MQNADPKRAIAMWPLNPVAYAKLGEQAVVTTLVPNQATLARATTFARAALTHDPSSALAYAVLGLAADARHDASARPLLLTSERLSRRLLLPQLWLVEDAVGRDDVKGALRHFDIALRTSREAPAILYPVLLTAAGDPGITASLAALLRSGPSWRDSFLVELTTHGDPMVAWQLIRAGVGTSIPTEVTKTLISRLIEGGHPEQAFALAGGSRNGETSLDLARPSGHVAPFFWNLAAADSVDAVRQPDGSVEAAVRSAAPQAAISRLAALQPGAYTMAGGASYPDGSVQGKARWTLTCLDGRLLAELPLSAGNADARPVNVPAACRFQWLRLEMTAAPDINGFEVSVSALRVTPRP